MTWRGTCHGPADQLPILAERLLQAVLSDLVRGGMARAKLNQRKLAAAAQISDNHLSEMLLGRSQGSIEVWDKLLRAVGSPLVMGWSGEMGRARQES